MKKTKEPAKQPHSEKGFLALAGEALHVLGEEIGHGKDKIVEVTAEKFTAVKKAIRKITHKKAAASKKKAAAKKVAPKKAAKGVAPKKKPARKKA
ncbi:MAG TPA: hypothetical protein VGM89_18945 [Puia sp.]